MNRNNITQLELDFSVIKAGTKVRVSGYDCHNWLDITNAVGIVDSYLQRTIFHLKLTITVWGGMHTRIKT